MSFIKKLVSFVLFLDGILFTGTGFILMFTDIIIDMRALTVLMLFALTMLIGMYMYYYWEEEE